MGCCVSASEVKEDASVVMACDVKDIVLIVGPFTRTAWNGVMYVQGDSFYYQSGCGKSLLCCKACRWSFKLSEITRVELFENEIMKCRLSRSIRLSPGLRIKLFPNVTIVVSMPDAEKFASQLQKSAVCL